MYICGKNRNVPTCSGISQVYKKRNTLLFPFCWSESSLLISSRGSVKVLSNFDRLSMVLSEIGSRGSLRVGRLLTGAERILASQSVSHAQVIEQNRTAGWLSRILLELMHNFNWKFSVMTGFPNCALSACTSFVTADCLIYWGVQHLTWRVCPVFLRNCIYQHLHACSNTTICVFWSGLNKKLLPGCFMVLLPYSILCSPRRLGNWYEFDLP